MKRVSKAILFWGVDKGKKKKEISSQIHPVSDVVMVLLTLLTVKGISRQKGMKADTLVRLVSPFQPLCPLAIFSEIVLCLFQFSWEQFLFLFLEAGRFKLIYEDMSDTRRKCSVITTFALSDPVCLVKMRAELQALIVKPHPLIYRQKKNFLLSPNFAKVRLTSPNLSPNSFRFFSLCSHVFGHIQQ